MTSSPARRTLCPQAPSPPQYNKPSLKQVPPQSGIVTTSDQSLAGVKTFTSGALIKGGDGSAVPAGYVGEVVPLVPGSAVIGTAGAFTTIFTFTLNKGVYIVWGQVTLAAATTVVWNTNPYIAVNITTVEGTEQGAAYAQHGLASAVARTVNTNRPFFINTDNTTVYVQGSRDIVNDNWSKLEFWGQF